MPLLSYKFAPGFDKQSTPYGAENKWIDGETLYESKKYKEDFLNWIGQKIIENKIDKDISKECYKFYHDKTKQRLNLFLNKKNPSYKEKYNINGLQYNSLIDYLKKINWE